MPQFTNNISSVVQKSLANSIHNLRKISNSKLENWEDCIFLSLCDFLYE